MGRWAGNLSLLETATMATATLLSMATDQLTHDFYREWHGVVLGEMEKALEARETTTSKDYDDWLAIPNEPGIQPAPWDDGPAPEEFIPTEQVEFNPFSLDPGREF